MTKTPARIVSLVPSLTETLFDLGLDSHIVGATRFCVEPAARLMGRTRIGGTKNPDRDKIASLRPDLVVVNTEENRPEDIAWFRERFGVFECFPTTVQHAADMVLALGRAVGRSEEADGIRLLIEAEALRIEAELYGERRLRVFYPIWKDPWMSVNKDTYVHSVLRTCGAENIFGDAMLRYPEVAIEQIYNLQPDLILLPSEPYAFSEPHRYRLLNDPMLGGRQVVLVDGKAFSWHGSRTPRGLRAAHTIIHSVRQEARRDR